MSILFLESWAGRRNIPCEVVNQTKKKFLVKLGADALLPYGIRGHKGGCYWVPKTAVKEAQK